MKKQPILKSAMLILTGILIVGISGLYAGTEVKDVINMDNKAYDKHTKSIAVFTHKKHIEDYKIGCGECHHDVTHSYFETYHGKVTQLCSEGAAKCYDCHGSHRSDVRRCRL